MHEADEPDLVGDLHDAHLLAGERHTQGPDPLLGKADAASPSAHADRILPDPPFPHTRDGRHSAVQSDERSTNCFEQSYLWLNS